VARPSQPPTDTSADRDRRDYPVLDLLDRLEELLEEMDELGVTTRDDVERRIGEIEGQLRDVVGEE
jgi:hypothetical protein